MQPHRTAPAAVRIGGCSSAQWGAAAVRSWAAATSCVRVVAPGTHLSGQRHRREQAQVQGGAERCVRRDGREEGGAEEGAARVAEVEREDHRVLHRGLGLGLGLG